VLHRFRLPRRATIAAVTAAMSASIAAGAIASDPAAAQTVGTASAAGVASQVAATTTPMPDPSPQWRYAAEEGQTFALDRTRQVRYGAKILLGPLGYWSVGTVAARQVSCTNATFGDPYPGVVKHCEVDVSPWTLCANEGQICRVDGARWVRYGVPAYGSGEPRYSVRMISGDTVCGNAQFGDPAPGAVKQCWVFDH
jgi:hypothetical protein